MKYLGEDLPVATEGQNGGSSEDQQSQRPPFRLLVLSFLAFSTQLSVGSLLTVDQTLFYGHHPFCFLINSPSSSPSFQPSHTHSFSHTKLSPFPSFLPLGPPSLLVSLVLTRRLSLCLSFRFPPALSRSLTCFLYQNLVAIQPPSRHSSPFLEPLAFAFISYPNPLNLISMVDKRPQFTSFLQPSDRPFPSRMLSVKNMIQRKSFDLMWLTVHELATLFHFVLINNKQKKNN